MTIHKGFAKHIPIEYFRRDIKVPDYILRNAIEKFLSDSDLVKSKSERYEMVHEAGRIIDVCMSFGYPFDDLKLSCLRKSIKFPTMWLYNLALESKKGLLNDRHVKSTVVTEHERNGILVSAHIRRFK